MLVNKLAIVLFSFYFLYFEYKASCRLQFQVALDSCDLLRGLGILTGFSDIVYKADNFCDFLFAFLCAMLLLERGLLYNENICSKFVPCRVLFQSGSFSDGKQNNFDSCLP